MTPRPLVKHSSAPFLAPAEKLTKAQSIADIRFAAPSERDSLTHVRGAAAPAGESGMREEMWMAGACEDGGVALWPGVSQRDIRCRRKRADCNGFQLCECFYNIHCESRSL